MEKSKSDFNQENADFKLNKIEELLEKISKLKSNIKKLDHDVSSALSSNGKSTIDLGATYGYRKIFENQLTDTIKELDLLRSECTEESNEIDPGKLTRITGGASTVNIRPGNFNDPTRFKKIKGLEPPNKVIENLINNKKN